MIKYITNYWKSVSIESEGWWVFAIVAMVFLYLACITGLIILATTSFWYLAILGFILLIGLGLPAMKWIWDKSFEY